MTYSTIGDHVELQRGTTYKSALLDQPGPVLLGLGSIERDGGFRSDKLRTYGGPSAEKLLVRPGDLYVSLKDVTQAGDLLGAIARVPKSVSVGRMTQDTVKLIFKSDIPKEYFYWLLRTPQYRQYCRSHATGTTNLGLSRDDFFSFKIPDLDAEKRLLTDSLENLEAKIRTNHQINQTLEQMAQAIFKSWFVDFEPVKAKIAALEAGGSEEDALLAAMQAISGKSEAELTRLQAEQSEQYAELRATAELFPSAMQDSELGEIPEGWEVAPLSAMVDLIGGGTPKKSESSFWNGDICWFSVKDVPSDGNVFVVDTEDKITEEGLNRSSTKLLPVGTTIITARGTVGKLALTGVPTAMNQSCYGVVPSDESGPYLNYLRLSVGVDTLKRNTHGAVFDTITRSTFDTVVQPRSCLPLRRRFEQAISPMFEAIRNNLLQINSLSEARDSLLPKLLSGELPVSDNGNQPIADSLKSLQEVE